MVEPPQAVGVLEQAENAYAVALVELAARLGLAGLVALPQVVEVGLPQVLDVQVSMHPKALEQKLGLNLSTEPLNVCEKSLDRLQQDTQ